MGCDVSQIVKSLIFRSIDSDAPILVLASGANRVDEGRLAEIVGGPVERATAEFVRTRTGYAIGGVPPIGHVQADRRLPRRALARSSCAVGRGGLTTGGLFGHARLNLCG